MRYINLHLHYITLHCSDLCDQFIRQSAGGAYSTPSDALAGCMINYYGLLYLIFAVFIPLQLC